MRIHQRAPMGGSLLFKRFHPLVMTLVIYAMADVAFSVVMGISAYHMVEMWYNPYYPLLHACLTFFSVLSVYLIACSSVELALGLHGTLKLALLLWTIHCMYDPRFYSIAKEEAVAIGLYYLLTIIFEMTAFFVINKMNIPFFPYQDVCPSPVRKVKYEEDDDDDEVNVTCC